MTSLSRSPGAHSGNEAAGRISLASRFRPASLVWLAIAAVLVVLEGRIARRAFLGECWNYEFAPAGGGSALTVTAAPDEVLAASAPAWLTIDPTQFVPIA